MRLNEKTKQRGQSFVEFGLVLPLLLLLILGFLDLGRAVYYYSAIGNAAREGARYASVRPMDLQGTTSDALDDQAEVRGVVQKYSVSVGLDASKITFPTVSTHPDSPEDRVTVKVVYDFFPITPFIPTVTLQAESTMSLAPVARQ